MNYEKLVEIKKLIIDYGKYKQNETYCEENYTWGIENGAQDKIIKSIREKADELLGNIMDEIKCLIVAGEK
jgi:hypothetical protein